MTRPLLLLMILLPGMISAARGEAPIVVLIGGNHSDPSPAQLAGMSGRGGNSGLWRLKEDLKTNDGVQAVYFNWNGTPAGEIDSPRPGGAHHIARWIQNEVQVRPAAPVILVGNSWGGHTAWQVCRILEGHAVPQENGTQRSINAADLGETLAEVSRPVSGISTEAAEPTLLRNQPLLNGTESDAVVTVERLILLDPSSFGRGKQPMPTILPQNVRRAVNFHTRNLFGWRGWLQDERLANIDLGDPAAGYLDPEGPPYHADLSWRAHVAAEWDERIHMAIRSQIVAAAASAGGAIPRDRDEASPRAAVGASQ